MVFVEQSPWPTLTLAVSLEAIFLSTFVMIGQNRQGTFQQAKADHDFVEEDQELKVNTELTRTIHELTLEMHTRLFGQGPVDQSQASGQTAQTPRILADRPVRPVPERSARGRWLTSTNTSGTASRSLRTADTAVRVGMPAECGLAGVTERDHGSKVGRG